jgi:hypothetical protein
MLPTALSLSGDGSWRAPMGVAVIGASRSSKPIIGRWFTTGGKNARPPVPQAAE